MTSTNRSSRRRFVRAVGVAGAASVTGLSGCIGSITGGGGGPIRMGSILPITGALSPYGPGMQEAANLAVKHVNDAGGPLGRPLEMHNADSETKPDKAVQRYNALVNEQNIVGFVGAASSGVSVPLAQNVASDQVMQVSNASTTPALAEIGYGDDGEPPKYFGRTAPNDGQQGIVMGKVLNEGQYVGADSAAFLFVNNPYGEGLADKAANAFDGTVTAKVGYDKKTTDYTSTLDKVFADDPDAVGFVGYPGNGKTILKQWANGGYGGQWVSSEGVNNPEFWQSLSEITDGFYVTSPDPKGTAGAETFRDAIGEKNTLFAPHAYDAVVLMALSMHKAGEASGRGMAENMQSVSRDGTTVTVGDFQAAKDALDNGESINYQGASSPVDMNANLEPLNRYSILRVNDGETKVLESIPRSYFEGKL